MKILHVEDEAIVSLAMKSDLRKIGCEEIYSVSTGEKALRILEEHDIDVIILDIGLVGDLNGIETAKLINEKYSIPIIFVSGYTSRNDFNQINNVVGIITKPINFSNIKNILEKIWK